MTSMRSDKELLAVVKKVPIFANLTEEFRQRLVKALESKHISEVTKQEKKKKKMHKMLYRC